MRKKIILTGGDGFIGGYFKENYQDVFEIDAYPSDIRDFDVNMYDGYDFCVHLAGLAGVRLSHQIPEEFWDHNVNGSQQVFRSCRVAKVPVIYASSSSVYEWWLSPYATTKKVVEEIASPQSLGLRFHTVYGPNSRTDMLYDMFLKKDSKVKYLTNHTRDYTHVEDVCNAIALCIKNYYNIDEPVIDVGAGTPVKITDVADKVWPGHNLPLKEVEGEREHTCADPTVLKRIGWYPMHNILEDEKKKLTV